MYGMHYMQGMATHTKNTMQKGEAIGRVFLAGRVDDMLMWALPAMLQIAVIM